MVAQRRLHGYKFPMFSSVVMTNEMPEEVLCQWSICFPMPLSAISDVLAAIKIQH